MKKAIYGTALIFLILNLLYLLLIRYSDWNFKKRLESQSFSDPSFQMLILGNSFAMEGIDAELITESGITAYNLAIIGASLKTNIVQLEEYLESYKTKPKYVLLGVGSYYKYFDSDVVHPIVDFTSKNKKYGIKDLPLVKFKGLFQEVLKKIVSKPHRQAKLVLGQLRTTKIEFDTSKYIYTNKFPVHEFVSNKYISSILQICNDNDIKLIVVEMPGSKRVRHQSAVNSFMLDSVFKNGIIIDMNTFEDGKIFNDNEDWIGDSHLNVNGAKKFTQLFLNKVAPYLD